MGNDLHTEVADYMRQVRDILHEKYNLTKFQTHMAVFDSDTLRAAMDNPDTVINVLVDDTANKIYKEWINDKPIRKKPFKFPGW